MLNGSWIVRKNNVTFDGLAAIMSSVEVLNPSNEDTYQSALGDGRAS